MSAMKEMSKVEPLVEVANNNKIFTTDSAILDINLEKVTVAELDFCNTYKIKAKKTQFLNNLVVWFDCFFSHGKKPIKLTTSTPLWLITQTHTTSLHTGNRPCYT